MFVETVVAAAPSDNPRPHERLSGRIAGRRSLQRLAFLAQRSSSCR